MSIFAGLDMDVQCALFDLYRQVYSVIQASLERIALHASKQA